eukprot:5667634-Amphidinium_carterae.3
MLPKDRHSLDHQGALGRFIMINFFGDGETTLVTETGKIIKGLKPTLLDKKMSIDFTISKINFPATTA